MHFLSRSLLRSNLYFHQYCRTFSDSAPTIKCLRDRGLDHAVEREKNLRPLLNVKNLIKSEPAKSLPISIIAQHKDFLEILIRPIDFIRRYPSIFEEFLPGGIGIHPHIKLTPEVLNLDAEEQLVYQSESYKQELADRLLKLLMISRINRIPLRVLDILKWDLGLPQDYVKNLVPEFPDYFRVIGGKESSSGLEGLGELELVCWSNKLAVSVLEKKVMNGEKDCSKGMPIAFPMKFSEGMVIDKKAKKWVDEWQKLPYVSPYENAAHLSPSSDESDKWAAAILHELLNLFVAKKTERENVLCLGEHLGIRSRFKRVLLHHPGIFYVSSKLGTYTVVLREAYKRGLLMENNPLMRIRNQYIHLMHMVKEDKAVAVSSGNKQDKKQDKEMIKRPEKEENDVGLNDLSGSEIEDASDDDDHEEEEVEKEGQRGTHGNATVRRRKTNDTKVLGSKAGLRSTEGERVIRKHRGMNKDRMEEGEYENRGQRGLHNARVRGGKTNNWKISGSKAGLRNTEGENQMRKHRRMAKDKIPPTTSRRTEVHGERNTHRSSGRSLTGKRSVY
ncbi:hypothetical protein SLEP1_g32125 [Rubroshorea leprosula]|uniref:PORR domain-containing protein n=1 Tax=Rubroshorea leprosula TaxID=152421 RepID=A0AAV5KCD4_9ROSI|nr:hypothetical protein SLEP1_g32125 [Rubroshorea leprosula]